MMGVFADFERSKAARLSPKQPMTPYGLRWSTRAPWRAEDRKAVQRQPLDRSEDQHGPAVIRE
jgi:hypothetical protein